MQESPPSTSIPCTQHDAGTQVDIVPERKSPHVQVQVRTKATGIIVVQSSDVCDRLVWLLSGRISSVVKSLLSRNSVLYQ